METELRVGDVVHLKSGGIRMTVEHVDGDQVACIWFDNKLLERAMFVAGVLVKYVPVQVNVIPTRRA